MKYFVIGVVLICLGTVATFVAMYIFGKETYWVLSPMILVFIGGGFQVKAFIDAKRSFDDLGRRYRDSVWKI